MKKQLHSFSRMALVAVATSAFCFALSASAAESPSSPAPMQKPNGSASPAAMTKRSPMNGNKAMLDRKDRDFMMAAAKGGLMEVYMGEMAQKMGQSADVKKIGVRMVADHTKANNELMALAMAKGVKLDTRHKMSKMESANFDQMYLSDMVKDHQKDVADFQREAKNGADPDVKQFAAKTLPTLQEHLQMVKAAQGKAPMKKS